MVEGSILAIGSRNGIPANKANSDHTRPGRKKGKKTITS